MTIVRHCEAKPAKAGEADYDRVLNKTGRREADHLRALAEDESALGRFGPVCALVSSAARTRETFARGFEGTDFVSSVQFSELIYNGRRKVTAEDLLIDLAAIDPVTKSLMVIAHNPSVHELLSVLCSNLPDTLRRKFPTGAAYVLALPEDRQIGLARYELVASYEPD